MDYDKLIAPAAEAMRPSGIRKFFDLADGVLFVQDLRLIRR